MPVSIGILINLRIVEANVARHSEYECLIGFYFADGCAHPKQWRKGKPELMHMYLKIFASSNFHSLPHTHQSQRCRFTNIDPSLMPGQRSLQACTLHFPGCRRANQGQDGMVFPGLMKRVCHTPVCMCEHRRKGQR